MRTALKTTDGRRKKGEKRRQVIMEAAIDCIVAHGLSGTTLDTVAARAKASRALVVFHFKSKNRMYIEVLNYLGKQYGAGWHAAVGDKSGSAADRLFRVLEYIIRFARDYPKYISVWHAFWGDAAGSTLYREVSFARDQKYLQVQFGLLRDMVEEGGYDLGDLETLNHSIQAMMFGLWWEAHLNPGPDQYTNAMRVLTMYLGAMFPKRDWAV